MMQADLPVELLNRLANQKVNLLMLGYESVDLSPFYSRPGNHSIGNEAGVILFCHLGNEVYEGHLLMDRRTRGKKALEHAQQIITTLFTLCGASAIVGQIPVSNRAAQYFTRRLGFASLGVSADHSGCPCVNYRLEKQQWVDLSAALSLASAK